MSRPISGVTSKPSAIHLDTALLTPLNTAVALITQVIIKIICIIDYEIIHVTLVCDCFYSFISHKMLKDYYTELLSSSTKFEV